MDGKWSLEETKSLFSLVERAYKNGDALSSAFSEMAIRSGKTVNGIRNYYYSQLRVFEMMPSVAVQLGINIISAKRASFELFTSGEIDELIEKVLVEKAKGKSVRAIIATLSGGDGKKALRLQNKYRSTVACHRDRVSRITARLAKAKTPYYDPYLKRVVNGENEDGSIARLAEYIGTLDGDKMVDVVKLLLSK